MPLVARLKSILKKVLYGAPPVWDTPWQHRYPGYTPEDLWVFDRFKNIPRTAEPGFLKDYLGVRTRPQCIQEAARVLAGHLQEIPVPGDWHSETIEHIGLLKSVLDAKVSYRVMELGAGWGPWLVAGGVAARHLGIRDIRMLGVEADNGHFASLKMHLEDNGFNPAEHQLFRAAVGASPGKALFPQAADSSNQWGARPAKTGDGADQTYLEKALATQQASQPTAMEEVEILAVADLLALQDYWDLVHIDVQGWEADICRAGIDAFNQRVKRVVVGTHSRKLDGDVMDLFHHAGWLLEHEKPTQFIYDRKMDNLENMAKGDGAQVWKNPRSLSN